MKKILIGAILLILVSCSTSHIISYSEHTEIHNQHLLEAIETFATDSTELYIPEFIKSTLDISENVIFIVDINQNL